jgi:MtN3 and saliva related transmembrane protein
MTFELATTLGTLAAICSTVSFAPQAWRIIKTRDTSNLSAATYVLTVTGFALWIAYGIALGQWPLIVPNFLCFLLAAFILVMKLLPSKAKQTVADAIDPCPPQPPNCERVSRL